MRSRIPKLLRRVESGGDNARRTFHGTKNELYFFLQRPTGACWVPLRAVLCLSGIAVSHFILSKTESDRCCALLA
jgi:hypothetical protein